MAMRDLFRRRTGPVAFPRWIGVPLSLAMLSAANTAHATAPQPWQVGLQPAATPVMAELTDVHNLLLIIVFGISIGVLGLLVYIAWRFRASRHPRPSARTHNTALEVVWTVIPALILVAISVPSMGLLYDMAQAKDPDMTVRVTGHQWYWSYAYPDQGGFSVDSFMVRDDELKKGQKRLLEAEPHMVVPVDTTVRVEITSGDVLHSWAVPSLGVKRDAVPGRTNTAWIRIEKPGRYYGQCSELCGRGHPYMPIVVEAVQPQVFKAWAHGHQG